MATAPHVQAPRINRAQHYAAPHITSRNFSAAHSAATHRVAARQISTGHVVTGRHVTSPEVTTVHNTARNAALARGSVKTRVNRNEATATTRTLPTNAAGPTGAAWSRSAATNENHQFTNTRQLTLNGPQGKRLQMHYTGGSPVLRNTALASLASRNDQTRALTQSTFRGNFARSDWGRDWGGRNHHHHHGFGFVLGFVGPVFWPYAYDDCIDYVLWPYAYDTFWPYAYDDVFQGIYGAYAPEYYAPDDVYAYAGAPASSGVYDLATGVSRPSAALAGGSQICSGEEQGLTDFPIQRIAQQVNPDQHQQALLYDLKAATAKAVNILKAACPNNLPSTPTGRLTAMRSRVEAMLAAVQAVRPALDAFYSSLSDEQKEHFNSLDEDINSAGGQVDVAGLCNSASPRAAPLPVARIERSLHLNGHQDSALNDLNNAAAQAADILKTGCQQAQTLTPTGRLAAMEDRLNAMLQALDTVQPALMNFYGSLSDEQKARFDRLNLRPA